MGGAAAGARSSSGERWRRSQTKERARLAQLVRESRGRLGNLSAKEREELRKLARKLDLKGMGRDCCRSCAAAGASAADGAAGAGDAARDGVETAEQQTARTSTSSRRRSCTTAPCAAPSGTST